MKKSKKKGKKRFVLDSKGFTLIELILVITVLGILAISALPTFYDISSNAKQSSRDGVIGAVNSGLALYRSNGLVNGTALTPATLDAVAVSTPCASATPCFGTVVDNGIVDTRWSTGAVANTYDWKETAAAVAITYTYDPVVGTFK